MLNPKCWLFAKDGTVADCRTSADQPICILPIPWKTSLHTLSTEWVHVTTTTLAKNFSFSLSNHPIWLKASTGMACSWQTTAEWMGNCFGTFLNIYFSWGFIIYLHYILNVSHLTKKDHHHTRKGPFFAMSTFSLNNCVKFNTLQ